MNHKVPRFLLSFFFFEEEQKRKENNIFVQKVALCDSSYQRCQLDLFCWSCTSPQCSHFHTQPVHSAPTFIYTLSHINLKQFITFKFQKKNIIYSKKNISFIKVISYYQIWCGFEPLKTLHITKSSVVLRMIYNLLMFCRFCEVPKLR